LYKAVEALIASNRANPVHDATSDTTATIGGGGCVAINLDCEKSPAINGTASSVTPGRFKMMLIVVKILKTTNK
jgi:hypothetical protein